MKKLFAIALMMVLALNAKADDIFATGYYVQNDQKVAAVYRNGEIIYMNMSVPQTGETENNEEENNG